MRTREVLPVHDLPGLRMLAGGLRCSKLSRWFDALPDSAHVTASQVTLSDRAGTPYTVRKLNGTSVGSYRINLSFVPQATIGDVVHIIARQDYAPRPDNKVFDVDYLSTSNLAWRRQNAARLDLIPQGEHTRHLQYEPTIMYVEGGAHPMTPALAELAVAAAVGVITANQ